MTAKYQRHELAAIFPPMAADQFKALATDVKANGLLSPITLYQGKVLDGVHRQDACFEAKVEPRYVDFDGDDPLAFVIGTNLHRRHLDESQRAMVAGKLATMRQGERTDLGPKGPKSVSNKEAAKLLKTSERSVKRAKAVQQQGTPELVKAVQDGNIGVTPAAEIAKLPKSEQNKAVDERRISPKRKRATQTKRRAVNQIMTELNSLAWSDAPQAARTRFVRDVGLIAIWSAADEDQRAALHKHIAVEPSTTKLPYPGTSLPLI